jgi:hypothetical protein
MEPSRVQEDVTIEMDDRYFQMTLSMRDEPLIEDVLRALAQSVKRGSSLRIRQTHRSSHSDSQHMILKNISNEGQMDSWLEEARLLRCVVCKVNE